MGQKVNPHGLRVGVIKDWESRWFADDENFSDNLVEDYKIREFLKKKLYHAGISKIEIERTNDRVKVLVYTAKPGVVIGKGGAEIEKLKGELAKYSTKKVLVDIKEVKRPDNDAQLVAENIAQQLENRISFRRAMKSCMGRAMKAGAKGIKTSCSGRLAVPTWLVQSSTAKETFRCRHFVLILIMDLQKQIQLMVRLVLRHGSTMVRYFQPKVKNQLRLVQRKGAINNVNA